MTTARSQRSQARKGSNVREMRPRRRETEPVYTLDRPDMPYIAALAILISVGMIMVYSTTAVQGTSALTRILAPLAVGIPGMYIAARIPMGIWKKFSGLLLAVSFLLLASLLLKSHNPLASEVNGAYRWIKVPVLKQFQPSEVAKLAFVLFAAKFLERRGQRMDGTQWLTFLGVLGALAAVIYKEPDLGTALVLGGIAVCMLIAAGVRWSVLFKGIVVAVAIVAVAAWTTEHQKERLMTWWNPWKEEYRQEGGYQVIQSWSAMTRGGLGGVGLGRSIYKLDDRLPEAETDFIFAIVAEEMGLIRAVLVLGVFILLAWRGFSIASRAPDRHSALVATGVTSWVAVQACLNTAVVTGTFPNTGVPLPFISSGGSSLFMLMIASGIVIGISQRRPVTATVQEAAVR